MRIESGPSNERKIRTMLMLLMVSVFAAWFAVDGWIRWPGANFNDQLDSVRPAEFREKARTGRIYPQLNKEDRSIGTAAESAIRQFDLARQKEALARVFGGEPTVATPLAWYYFGPTYRWELEVSEGRFKGIAGHATPHSEYDLAFQKILAMSLGVIAIFSLWFHLRVRGTRLVLDEGGLSYNGKGPIAWADMQSLDVADFPKKGWVDLHYLDHGSVRQLRLDEYHLAAFDDVIDAICSKKGFENPLPVGEAPAAGAN